MRVGWLADRVVTTGGAELTQAEFRDAAPAGVEVFDCPPGEVRPGLDAYVIHNCVTYKPEDIWAIGDTPVSKYLHDVWPHGDLTVKAHLLKHAQLVFCSPLQRDRMGLDGHIVPPPVNLARFRQAAQDGGERGKQAVCVGAWMNPGKAPHLAAEWAAGNGGIDFFGDGPFAPSGSRPVAYGDMPELLARYGTFVFLPTALEPFGRTVVEAWAAGCRLVVNNLVGARYWIEQAPDKLETAAEDFWITVTA